MSRRRLAFSTACAVVLVGVVLVGLGVGNAFAGHAGAVTHSASTPGVPQVPGVRTVTVTTTTDTTLLPGYGRPTIKLGDMNTPEEFILGQLYQLALEQQGYKVVLVSKNVGAPPVAISALKQGLLDIYPDYLDEWNGYVAHVHTRFNSLKTSYAAAKAYASAHGFVLLAPAPFSDTDGLGVTSAFAALNHVTSIAQLARGTKVVLGLPLEFQTNPHDLPALESAYGLDPANVQSIGVGLQYSVLQSDSVQAAYISTTDPQLASPGYVALADPKHVLGCGNVVPVTTPAVVHQEGRDFVATINRVDALLSTRAIRGLNAEVELDGHQPTAVAEQFLQGNGILPPSRYAPVTSTTTTTATATTRP